MPSADEPAPASRFAATLLGEAARLGVRDLVVCPGSRSQSLALVAAELERLGRVRLHVRIDERSAGFFALGLAIETGVPVPVVTTSGTAVANLHPAMLEAFHAGVPLVALTADRPAELLGIGANQATIQPGMFGDRIPCLDVPAPVGDATEEPLARRLAARLRATTGPLQLNLAFREPLASELPEGWLGERLDRPAEAADSEADGTEGDGLETDDAGDTRDAADETVLDLDPADGVPTIVIAGDRAGAAAEEAAHAGGWPLIAEISSGARYGRHLVVATRELLGSASPAPQLRDGVRRAVVFGHPTLTREIPALLTRDDVEVVVIGPTGGEPYNPGHHVARRAATLRLRASAEPSPDDRAWLRDWVLASRTITEASSSDPEAPDLDASRSNASAERARFGRQELAVARQRVDRAVLVDAVWRCTWPHDRLVVGASRLIRELDRRAPGKRVRVVANRGLAGIDGTIATALGVAVASQDAGSLAQAAGVTRALIGDLTLLHDAGSLLVGQGGEPVPQIQVIVGNDGGGTIFDGLEVATAAPAAAMDRVQYTPQHIDLAALASAYGWAHVRATTRAELEHALTSREHRAVLIEVPLER